VKKIKIEGYNVVYNKLYNNHHKLKMIYDDTKDLLTTVCKEQYNNKLSKLYFYFK